MAKPEPALAFVEVSSAAGELGALMSALRRVPGVADERTRRRLVFGLMARALHREPEAIKKIAPAFGQKARDGDAVRLTESSVVAPLLWHFLQPRWQCGVARCSHPLRVAARQLETSLRGALLFAKSY